MKTGISSGIVISGGLVLFLTVTAVNAQNTNPVVSASIPAPIVKRVPVAPDNLSPGTERVVKLFESGASRQELLLYAKNTPAKFNLSVADVNYLKDLGISTDVVFAMIQNPGSHSMGVGSPEQSQTLQARATSDTPSANPQPPANSTPKPEQVISEAAGSSPTTTNPDKVRIPDYYGSPENRDVAPAQSQGYQYYSPYRSYNSGPTVPRSDGLNGTPENPSGFRYYERFDSGRRWAP
jgi:hypothetical protein